MRVPTWCVHNIIMMSNALVKISLVSLSLSPHQLSPSDTAHPEHAPKADEKAAARWGVWPAPQRRAATGAHYTERWLPHVPEREHGSGGGGGGVERRSGQVSRLPFGA
jgi:hypothetical protein